LFQQQQATSLSSKHQTMTICNVSHKASNKKTTEVIFKFTQGCHVTLNTPHERPRLTSFKDTTRYQILNGSGSTYRSLTPDAAPRGRLRSERQCNAMYYGNASGVKAATLGTATQRTGSDVKEPLQCPTVGGGILLSVYSLVLELV